VIKNRKARIGRNPRTGQKVDVPAFKAPLFKFSKDAQAIFDKKLDSLTKTSCT
jgi:nucleoid DNA-binding protein